MRPVGETVQRILILDPEPSEGDILATALRKEGHDAVVETDCQTALDRFRRERFDLVIGAEGMDFLRIVRDLRKDAPLVLTTPLLSWDHAVEAARLGASYIYRDGCSRPEFLSAVSRSLHPEASAEIDQVLRNIGTVLGHSQAMKRVRELIRRAAPTDATVRVQGESGVGKELVARALHQGSPRAARPFVAVNCGALTETLLESEIFGHARGAFTGAQSNKVGLAEVAHTGTLFLDEVGEMSPALQVKVLRLIEEKEFKPVGSTVTKKVDVRFVTATNRNLEDESRRGTFRSDLFWRLNVIAIRIPPLRERKEDVPSLAEHFLEKYAAALRRPRKRFTPEAREAILAHPWPGNVRELENAVQRAVALSDGAEIAPRDLFETAVADLEAGVPLIGEGGLDLVRKMAEVESGYLRQALEKSGGDHAKASRLLKMTLRGFRMKLKKSGIEPDARC